MSMVTSGRLSCVVFAHLFQSPLLPCLPLPHPRHSKLRSVIIPSARRDGLISVWFYVVLAMRISRHKPRLIDSPRCGSARPELTGVLCAASRRRPLPVSVTYLPSSRLPRAPDSRHILRPGRTNLNQSAIYSTTHWHPALLRWRHSDHRLELPGDKGPNT